MTAPVFGDFLDQADQHLQAAARRWGAGVDVAAVAQGLLRLVTGMARYLDDRAPVPMVESIGRTDVRPWGRVAIDASMALGKAADCLHQAARTAGHPSREPGDELTGSLAAAATSLAAGRDLLHTHLAVSPEGLWDPRTLWAPVVTSPPVTRAVAGQIARWSRPLALIASRLASASAVDTQRQAALAEAAEWLWRTGMVTLPAQAIDPVTDEDRRLLRAIPAARSLDRRPPGGDNESVQELCAGIAVSAERLREAVLVTAQRARWVPATVSTWRWTARAAAIAGHSGELLLRSLASQPGLPADSTRLQAAATALARSWAAWRLVATTWAGSGVSTETQGHGPVATEISDLVLRMGRLARGDPHWAPSRRHQADAGDTARLAPGSSAVPALVAAVHQAADALADVAAADQAAVRAADQAGRLYVTTRSLPASYDIPRPYATAPADRTQALLDAYQVATYASAHAATTLAALALATSAPSTPLALARAAAEPRPGTGHDQIPAESANAPSTANRPVGPVELTIRDLRVKDPIVLLRAIAIDDAARRLIAQVQPTSQPAPAPGTATPAVPHPRNHPARLAAQDTTPPIPVRTSASTQNNNAANIPPQPTAEQSTAPEGTSRHQRRHPTRRGRTPS